MHAFSPQATALVVLGLSTSALSYPGSWLIQVGGIGNYLALDGTLSVASPSDPNLAQSEIIAYDNYAWALQIGPEPVSGQPYDPPYVAIDSSANLTKVVATLAPSDPSVSEETVGNWSLSDTTGPGEFALQWAVPFLGVAAFQVDGNGSLWAVFAGEGVPGAKSVNLTVTSNP